MSSLDPCAYFGFLSSCEADTWLEEVGGGGSNDGDGCVWPNNDGGGKGGIVLNVEGPGEGSHRRSSGRDPIGAGDEGRVTTGSKG